ncbi:MAG: hypothetical protein AB8C02_08080 [Halioglobus sp.]
MSNSVTVRADSAEMIGDHTQRALKWMYGSSRHTAKQLKRAAGVLVFGDMIKMGFGLGGEFGEGALIVDGEIVEYYALSGKEYGVSKDAAFKAKAIVFRTEKALDAFRDSATWRVGSNAAVPMVRSVEKSGKVLRSSDPIVGLVFTDSGLLPDVTLDGNKITRITR